ncbi:RNA/RNP complex-1-interacting phosphatase [Dunckerocampus dactyliophorus]|uniref:RNA/RNP complex-1-interacting phosphatase n=1 Tax=Dunckerocampus dactyliophorus TaxID=161453 RepID=UPI002406D37B|nr:RNA/RNP complex-1-interacting phosphatase [Dunckerocampus dactyliophorus]
MPRHGKKKGIPDRWLDYKAVGKRLDGTRFVAFKVPLKQSFNRQLPPSQVFGPWELLDAVKEDRQELGLIIDLTFTTCYYQPQDLPASLLCVKIFTEGHMIPKDDTILAFKRVVRRFLLDNADNDKLIGVHCTHGLNRTGYMICRYLIDVDRMDPEEAVKLFNLSRGHAIERQNYINDLRRGRRRSNKGMSECALTFVRGTAVARPLEGQDKGRAHTYGRLDRPPCDIPEEECPTYDSSQHGHPPRGAHQAGRPTHESPQHSRPPRGTPQQYQPACDRPPRSTHQVCRPTHEGGTLPFLLPRVPLHSYRWAPPHPANKWARPQYAQPHVQLQRPRPPLKRYTPRWANQHSGDRQEEGAGPGW